MAVISMKQLLDAGVHFGHQTRRWNPKMKRFIHGERAGIHIVDLHQTLNHLEMSYVFVRDLVADGGAVLFIGTKKQAQDSIQSYAERCNMPYIKERWLGGMLTNFQTISKRVGKMKEYQRMRDSGELEAMPKKEALLINRELVKLERNLCGIRDMEKLPDAIFVLDTKKEHIAVTEARKIGVPIVAVVDTNCDPDLVDYAIPGNDDAIRAGRLICRVISDAVLEGRFIRSKKVESDGDGVKRNALEEAEVAAQQEQACAEAATQAAERESRVAAAITGTAPAREEPAAEAGPEVRAEPAAEAVDVPVEESLRQAGDEGTSETWSRAATLNEQQPQHSTSNNRNTQRATTERTTEMPISAKDVKALRDATGAGMMDAKKALTETGGDMEAAKQILREKGLAKAVARADRDNDEGAIAIAVDGNTAALVQIKTETDFSAKNEAVTGLAQTLADAVLANGAGAVDAHVGALEDLKVTIKENAALGAVELVAAADGNILDTYLHVQGGRGVNAVIVEGNAVNEDDLHQVALHIAFAKPSYLSADEVPADEVEREKAALLEITKAEGKPEQARDKIVEGRLQSWYGERVLLEQGLHGDKTAVKDSLGGGSMVRYLQVVIGG